MNGEWERGGREGERVGAVRLRGRNALWFLCTLGMSAREEPSQRRLVSTLMKMWQFSSPWLAEYRREEDGGWGIRERQLIWNERQWKCERFLRPSRRMTQYHIKTKVIRLMFFRMLIYTVCHIKLLARANNTTWLKEDKCWYSSKPKEHYKYLPESLYSWDQRCHPVDSVTDQSQTLYTPSCCWPKCFAQPGHDGHSSFLKDISSLLRSHASFPPTGSP